MKLTPQGRFLFLSIKLEDRSYVLASVYVLNEKKMQYIDEVFSKLQMFSTFPIILGGDLNCITNEYLDYSCLCKARKKVADFTLLHSGLHRLLQKYDLCDIWRHLNPGARDYTHYSQQFTLHSRIDYLLVSKSLSSNLVASDNGLSIWSDHVWIDRQLHIHLATIPQSRWRLNSNLLYLEPIHTEIENKFRNILNFTMGSLRVMCGML